MDRARTDPDVAEALALLATADDAIADALLRYEADVRRLELEAEVLTRALVEASAERAALRTRLAAALERERRLCARHRRRDWLAATVLLARRLTGREES